MAATFGPVDGQATPWKCGPWLVILIEEAVLRRSLAPSCGVPGWPWCEPGAVQPLAGVRPDGDHEGQDQRLLLLEVAVAIDQAFPHRTGLFSRLTLLAAGERAILSGSGRVDADTGHGAVDLEPILVPGLLQTRDYARALFEAWQPAAGSDDLDAACWIQRQAILDRPLASCWRCWTTGGLAPCGWPANMMGDEVAGPSARCSRRLAVTIQTVRLRSARMRLLGGFFVGSFDDTPLSSMRQMAVEGIDDQKAGAGQQGAQAFRAAAIRGPAPRRLPRPDQESC